MWEVSEPQPVKLIIGILAAEESCLAAAIDVLTTEFGKLDLISPTWPFTQTEYYKAQTGENIVRGFITFENLIDPGDLAAIKIKTNHLEQQLAEKLKTSLPRPVNLDPGIIEPSKLILASTKNFSHRIYIGQNIYAELTLSYSKGKWESYRFTFGDYKEARYHEFFTKARDKLCKQLKEIKN